MTSQISLLCNIFPVHCRRECLHHRKQMALLSTAGLRRTQVTRVNLQWSEMVSGKRQCPLDIDDNRDLAAWGEGEDKEITKEKVRKEMTGRLRAMSDGYK